MPKLSLTMETGKIIRWLKKEGDKVEKGEPILEIETEKVTVEVEAPASGILHKILAKEGEEVPIQKTIAIIKEPGEEIPEETVVEAKREVTVPTAEKPVERVKASPLAKKLAKEYGIDLTKIKGTGPGGRILKEDVLRAVEEAKAAAAVTVTPTPPTPTPSVEKAKIVPLTGIRKTIGKRMAQSLQTAPQLTITMEVDMGEVVKLREQVVSETEKKLSLRVTYTDIIVMAVAKALKEFPFMNSRLEEDKLKLLEEVNVGVATAIEDGLVVPVVKNADKKSLVEISSNIRSLVEKARQGKLSIEDVSGGTFTVTNLGMYGVDVFTPIINPPESAILGVGRIVEKPVVKDGQIVIRPITILSLTFDHRVTDGAQAAVFLQRIKELLEKPFLLFI
ncbi:MAG: 2-oxo acid dehydrogenase subunit E2 [Candidatus Hecatellales archaeon]|nr:MAG: 2-oxo acid dehydrogenase subunit E2 [Candidatus Hecatellales archaeon]